MNLRLGMMLKTITLLLTYSKHIDGFENCRWQKPQKAIDVIFHQRLSLSIAMHVNWSTAVELSPCRTPNIHDI